MTGLNLRSIKVILINNNNNNHFNNDLNPKNRRCKQSHKKSIFLNCSLKL